MSWEIHFFFNFWVWGSIHVLQIKLVNCVTQIYCIFFFLIDQLLKRGILKSTIMVDLYQFLPVVLFFFASQILDVTLSRAVPNVFKVGLLEINSSSFPLAENVSIPPSFMKDILPYTEFWFQHSKNVVLLPSGLHGFSDVIQIIVPL